MALSGTERYQVARSGARWHGGVGGCAEAHRVYGGVGGGGGGGGEGEGVGWGVESGWGEDVLCV